MNHFSTLIAFILLIFNPVYGQVPDSLKYKSLLPYDFHLTYLKEPGAILIDVREYFEFRNSRIQDALNIPSSGSLEFSADTINKESALFLYCTTGYRSKKVAKYFYDKGFGKVYSLDGGIVLWKKDGFPVVKKRINRKK